MSEHDILESWLNKAGIDFFRTGNTESGFPDFIIFTPPPGSPMVRGVVIEITDRLDHEPGSLMDRCAGLCWSSIVAADADEAIAWMCARGIGYSLPEELSK